MVTAHVFSTLRYVPRTCTAFLQALTRQNQARLGDSDPFHPRSPISFDAWPAWRVPAAKAPSITELNGMANRERQEFDEEPTPSDALRLKGSVIPDVVLEDLAGTW